MNNEPVAWTKKDTLIFLGNYEFGSITIQVQKKKNNEFDIPLYTHPAKTLTEPSVKEIIDLWLYVVNNRPANDKRPVEWHFARAILRKAQEK